MKALLTLTLVLLANVALSQRFPPFRNCNPNDEFQIGVLEFDHDPQVNDPKDNYVFFVGHFLTSFQYGSVDYDLFLDGTHIESGTSTDYAGNGFNYGAGESDLVLPNLPQVGQYDLLLKVNDVNGNQKGCAGVSFVLEN